MTDQTTATTETLSTTAATTADTTTATTTTTTTEQPAGDKATTEGKQDDAQLLFANKDGEQKKDGEADPDKKDGDKDEKKDGEPELKVTDFELQEGFEIPAEVATELEAILNNKELDSKGKYQGLMNLHMKMMQQQAEGFVQFREGLRTAAKSDPVIGGDKLQESIKAADNAVVQLAKNPKFGGSEETYQGFVHRLTVLGLGDDPFVIRFLANTNKLLAHFKDDTVDGGNSGGGEAQKSVENILWKDMK